MLCQKVVLMSPDTPQYLPSCGSLTEFITFWGLNCLINTHTRMYVNIYIYIHIFISHMQIIT